MLSVRTSMPWLYMKLLRMCRVDIGQNIAPCAFAASSQRLISVGSILVRVTFSFSTACSMTSFANFQATLSARKHHRGSHRPVGSHQGRSAYRNKVSDSRSLLKNRFLFPEVAVQDLFPPGAYFLLPVFRSSRYRLKEFAYRPRRCRAVLRRRVHSNTSARRFRRCASSPFACMH